MKSCLITGCNGFIGSRLSEFLINQGLVVFGTTHNDYSRLANLKDKMTVIECDILDKQKIESVLLQVKPEIIFHLAAQSKVVASWRDPELTVQVNVLGTLNLLEAAKKYCPTSTILVVGAAAIYGSSKEKTPITEDHEIAASSPYAISKITQDYLARLYWQAYGLKIIRIRPFNITGAGNTGDACSDFAKGIVDIERGIKTHLQVGDLSSVRDITDVSDAVVALRLLALQGVAGDAYNLCSGKGYRIGDVLNKLIDLSSAEIKTVQDTSKKRPMADNFQIGDNSKLRALGWRPEVSIDTILSESLIYWRNK